MAALLRRGGSFPDEAIASSPDTPDHSAGFRLRSCEPFGACGPSCRYQPIPRPLGAPEVAFDFSRDIRPLVIWCRTLPKVWGCPLACRLTPSQGRVSCDPSARRLGIAALLFASLREVGGGLRCAEPSSSPLRHGVGDFAPMPLSPSCLQALACEGLNLRTTLCAWRRAIGSAREKLGTTRCFSYPPPGCWIAPGPGIGLLRTSAFEPALTDSGKLGASPR